MVAEALRFRNPMSRMLVWAPPKATAPPKLLACVSSRMSEPAMVVVNVVAPPTVKAPDWVIEPPAVALRLPLAFKVGRSMGAASNVSARLRRFVRPARAETVAPALTLRSDTSRMLPWVPPKATAPPKLLACVSSRMSEFVAVLARLVVPVTINAPDWVRLPPLVTVTFPLTVEAARFSALVSLSVTLFPLVMPTMLKLLAALFKVMSLAAPAASVVLLPR